MEINNFLLEYYNKSVSKIIVEHKTFLVGIFANPCNQQSLAGSWLHEVMAAVKDWNKYQRIVRYFVINFCNWLAWNEINLCNRSKNLES